MPLQSVPELSNERRPASIRIVDAMCVGMGIWTLCCQSISVLGGNLYHLLGLVSLVILICLTFRVRRVRSGESGEPDRALETFGSIAAESEVNREPSVDSSAVLGNTRRRWAARLLGAVSVLAALVVYHQRLTGMAYWWLVIGVLFPVAILVMVDPAGSEPAAPRRSRRSEQILWALAITAGVFALVLNRPNLDDTAYLNMAVTVADDPGGALLSYDGMHGIPDIPLIGQYYRVGSYEILNGALAYLSRIPAIYLFHFLFVFLAASFAILSSARLLRILVPDHWLMAVVALIAVALQPSWASGVFLRIFQGKLIMLSVFIPLVIAYGLKFALNQSRGDWWKLTWAQIAAVGCNPTALWLAPISALLAVVSFANWRCGSWRVIAKVAVSSLPVLAVGLWARILVLPAPVTNQVDVTTQTLALTGQNLAGAFRMYFHHPDLSFLAAACVPLAWTCCRGRRTRRFAAIVPLVFFLGPANIYTESLTSYFVGPVYWRLLWGLPLSYLLVLVLLVPLRLLNDKLKIVGRVLFCVSLLVFVLIWPTGNVFEKYVKIMEWPPGLKVDKEAYIAARRLNEVVPARSNVLADIRVSAWIPTFHRHPYPLITRDMYTKEIFAPEEYNRRRKLVAALGGIREVFPEDVLLRDLDYYEVKGVCFWGFGLWSNEVRSVLQKLGFALRIRTPHDYEIWVRRDQAQSIVAPEILSVFAIRIDPSSPYSAIRIRIKTESASPSTKISIMGREVLTTNLGEGVLQAEIPAKWVRRLLRKPLVYLYDESTGLVGKPVSIEITVPRGNQL